MSPDRRLKLQYTLGLLLVCAGAVVVILGSRWPGLALVAAGAALYFPASRHRAATQSGDTARSGLRGVWGVAAAVLVAASLGLLAGPRIMPPEALRPARPVALIAASALLVWVGWRFFRRAGTHRDPRPPRGGPEA